MFQDMPKPINGERSTQLVPAFYGFVPYNSRLTYKSGGFYVENGVCYIDAIFTVTSAFSSDKTMFTVGTALMPSSEQGTSFIALGDIKVKYTSTIDDCFYSVKSGAVGDEFHFVGNFKTTAPNTELS